MFLKHDTITLDRRKIWLRLSLNRRRLVEADIHSHSMLYGAAVTHTHTQRQFLMREYKLFPLRILSHENIIAVNEEPRVQHKCLWEESLLQSQTESKSSFSLFEGFGIHR